MNRRLLGSLLAILVAGSLSLAQPAVGAVPRPHQVAQPAAATAADQAQAARLVNRFFAMLQSQDTAKLARFLSPAFQVQRPDGSGSGKAAYLASPPKVEAYEISDLVATRAGDTMVARYVVTASETINGALQKKDPAPRLSVFKKNAKSGQWQLLAHANFNAIAPPA